MLNKKEFSVLTYIEANKNEKLTQKELAEALNFSVGTVNKLWNELEEKGFINEKHITKKGLAALEPYRVKRAIFIAAGFGSRLVPITLNTPKPLVRVKGVRIIDTLLDAVIAAGIEEIIIVRGYLAEQFDQLKYKYPMVKFVENPLYNEANNISSVMCIRYLLSNAYILEADLLLSNPKLITKYQYSSNYLGVPTEKTDDWCFFMEGDRIKRLGVGGLDCHHMFGISYWSEDDGKKLCNHVEQVYNSPGGKERYWDQVALGEYIKEYNISVRECTFDDIVEIDTFRELKELDPVYDV
ncbi:MAG: winged helix-turn-helix transcriptional regulator [Phascolarctobacterium sp.]|nr:winged helix-turn-helix transcriptional regulator [Phascolarctobacterium sp.]